MYRNCTILVYKMLHAYVQSPRALFSWRQLKDIEKVIHCHGNRNTRESVAIICRQVAGKNTMRTQFVTNTSLKCGVRYN